MTTIASTDTLIAAYFDGSGTYDIHHVDGHLITVINATEPEYREIIAQALTATDDFADVDSTDWMLSERFGSSPDFGDDGIAWIDGVVYRLADSDLAVEYAVA